MKSFITLFKNELKLNIRNMNMVIFAILMPLAVLFIFGFIYGTKPAAEGVNYTFLEQSFGALCTISMCAGSFMGLPLVISEYRERNILKHFRVTPISPCRLLLVEVSIYIVYCMISLLTLGCAAMPIWKVQIHGNWLAFLGSWLLTMLSSFCIGMMIGSIAKNSKQASMIASALYFPMLLFSGATLPLETMPIWMQKIINVSIKKKVSPHPKF